MHQHIDDVVTKERPLREKDSKGYGAGLNNLKLTMLWELMKKNAQQC